MLQNFKWVGLFAVVLVMGLVISIPANAQVSGATLSGVVNDAQAGAVPNAKVTVTNPATGVSVETTTNNVGAYTVPNLNAADYEVRVAANGFSTAVVKITLAVGAKQELNIPLAVGEVSQTVQVEAVAPQIELQSSTITDEVTATTLRELPLNGRDWASLATLQPGVVEARTHLDVTHVGGGGGRGFGDQLSVGGGRPTQNSYRLDGAIVNDYSNAGPGSVLGKNLGVDAISEFTVLTSNYSAEYGFTSGGVINAVTKSGTNSFHGTAFDFLRNDKLDAANFFTNSQGLAKNSLRQNQFGAAAGWRVLKDKLFLFGDYEGVRKSAGLPVTNGITISDAVRAGNVVNLTNGTLVNVPTINANILKYLPLYPHPAPGAIGCVAYVGAGNVGGCNPNIGNAPFLGHQGATENFVTGRADYRLGTNDTLFGTYLRDASSFNTPNALNDTQQAFTSYRQAGIVEETHVFSPVWSNTVRVALDRTNNLGGNSPIANNPAAADPTLGMNTNGLSGFTSAGITLTNTQVTALPGGVGYSDSIQDFWGQIAQVYDDAFHSSGNHSFKFGFSFFAQQVDGYVPLNGGNGSGTFNSLGTYAAGCGVGNCITTTAAQSGCGADTSCGGLVNFLTDQPLSATRPVDLSAIHKHYLRDKVFGVYFQDDYRVRPNLTLNLGLRYEMSTIPTEKYGKIGVMPLPTTVMPCLPTPTITPPIDQSCSATDPTSALSKVFFTKNPTLKNFEPRIGFAWDPFKSGKTSIRGGYGIFDSLPLAYQFILNNNSSAPWRGTFATLGNGAGGFLSSPGPGVWPFGIPALVNFHINNPLSRTWMYVEQAPKRNYVQQYSLNIQRQLTPTLSILVGYSGSRAFHNPFQADSVNTVLPQQGGPGVGYYWPVSYSGALSTAAQTARLLNPTTGNSIFNTMWQSRSWYNGLQIKLDKRLSNGFQVQGSYTYSKSMDDSSGSTAGDTFQLDSVSEPWYDLSLSKGLSDFDVRHNLVINALWNSPDVKKLGVVGDKVLGGWQLGVIMTVASGIPESVILGQDIGGEVTQTVQPPNLVSGCNTINSNYRHSLSYINPSCFSLVPQTAANTPFCDTVREGAGGKFGTPAGFCPNIRGNLGRDTIIGPGLVNTNFSAFKNNYVRKISESFNVQFRAEMFNVFNRTNFAPSSQLSTLKDINGNPNASFGLLQSTQGDNRVIQLALKMIW